MLLTNDLERCKDTRQQRVSRLGRGTLAFSKTLAKQIGAIVNTRCVSVRPSPLPRYSTNGYRGEHVYAFAMTCQRRSVLGAGRAAWMSGPRGCTGASCVRATGRHRGKHAIKF